MMSYFCRLCQSGFSGFWGGGFDLRNGEEGLADQSPFHSTDRSVVHLGKFDFGSRPEPSRFRLKNPQPNSDMRNNKISYNLN